MRKVKVSAQVTAAITLLEAFGNFVNVVIWICISNLTKYEQNGSFYAQTGPLPQGMLLYFVLLSYTFLMNTRHNRYRVVDNGWATVLKNVLPPWVLHFPILTQPAQPCLQAAAFSEPAWGEPAAGGRKPPGQQAPPVREQLP